MSEQEVKYIDEYTTEFAWKELPIISKHFTFRELLSESFQEFFKSKEQLDNYVTKFEYVPCTQLYLLSDDEEEISVHINMNQYTINELYYNYLDHNNITKFYDIIVQQYKNAIEIRIMCNKEKEIILNESELKKTITVNKDLLDSIHVQCANNKIVTKDGILINS